MIVRTTLFYLLIFVGVLVALDAGAYAFVHREYVSLLGPSLDTPEGRAGMNAAMRNVLLTILAIDLPLVAVVGAASWLLARAAIAPIAAARERERIFAADAAHELRSPLTTIASVAQAARARASAESREAFESIAKSALEASALVSDLLTLARSPGRGVLQCEPVDLGAIVAACARDAAPAAALHNVRIESNASSAIVDGDARRLRELVRNLLENAIRHARTCVWIASEQSGRTCSIVVEDDGQGVEPHERERIFERFYRRAQDGSGTGLGLAIVRWIAHAHHGSVGAAGAAAGGARFVATLPAHSPK
ncbi:MAG: HAMP domain-containing histidine kinase [Candidatus Eremiobacteraeota bacterium]|nr:HAMP domain-containing histidine kinase [Candidatus Eremiobacteraeota bacterium]